MPQRPRLNRMQDEKNKRIVSLRSAVSIVEVLSVFGIIAIILSILAPAVMSARESARKAQCCNNLRQIGIGITNFHTTWGHLPRNNYTFVNLRSELELGELNLSGRGPLLKNVLLRTEA